MERPLLRLPGWTVGETSCRLPLSDLTAAALLSARLEVDAATRRHTLYGAVRSDPPLALWCALHPRRPRTPPGDCRELAEWLDEHLTAVLRWPDEPRGPAPAEGADRAAHAARAARALLLADATEQRTPDAETADRARLLAFLSQAYEWLVATAVPRGPEAVERLAPAWLRRLMAELREPSPADPALLAVIAALNQPADDETARFNSNLAERWGQELPWAQETLPRLMARCARCDAVEDDFDAALRREKLAALQKLAYGASHEINNPLANIATRAQTLLQDETDPERRRALATINDQAFRAYEMIANMMLFAKPPELDLAQVDVRQVVAQVLEEMASAAQEQGTALRAAPGEDLPPIQADATQLAVLLRALVRNALEAVACGGEVEVAVQLAGPNIQLRVRDTGPGLSDEARRHLFDPFYSSREAGRGLGFGLSWCWVIVEMHQGEIAFESAAGQGATFTILLPIAGPLPS